MRIVYIHTGLIPSDKANSVHVMKMCDALAGLGHQIFLLAPRLKHTADSVWARDLKKYYNLKKDIPIEWLSRPEGHLGFFIYGLKSVISAKREKPDLIYTRCLSTAYFLSYTKNAFIYEIHLEPTSFPEIILYKNISKSKACLRLVCISQELKRRLMSISPSREDKLLVAHDAVDLSDFDSAGNKIAERLLNLPDNRIVCMYAGSICKGRGIELIMHAASRIQNAVFVLVGKVEKEFEKAIRSHSGNIICLGHIPYSEVPAYLRRADILLLPYQPNAEILDRSRTATGSYCSPMKAFEYLAAGKTIICSDLPNLREIFDPDKNAVLVAPPDSKEAWSAAIIMAIESKEKREELSLNALSAAKCNTWSKRTEKILQAIESS